MEETGKVFVTIEEVRRLARRLMVFVALCLIAGIGALAIGTYVPAVTKVPTCNSLTAGSLTVVLLSNMGSCSLETFFQLLAYLVVTVLGVWLATACSAEKDWKGLLKAIFSPDGNESPVLLVLIYVTFFLMTVSTTPFTSLTSFVLGAVIRLARNSILGLVFSYIAIRGTGIRTLDAYLRENKTPHSNGLPWFQAIALILAYFVGHALLGG